MGSKIKGLPNGSGKLIYHEGVLAPRAALYINKNLQYLPLSRFIQRDIAAAVIDVRLPGGNVKVVIASTYHHEEEASPPEEVVNLVNHCKKLNMQFIIGCDSNAHHTVWASSDINKRGENLLDFLMTEGVGVANRGSEPTFRNAIREEVLDLTLISPALHHKISNWHVSDEASLSDHRQIRFDIDIEPITQEPKRNPRRTNWELYRCLLEGNGELSGVRGMDSVDGIDLAAEHLRSRILTAYEDSCPLKRSTSGRDVPWWNSNLAKLRKKARTLYNKWSKSRTLEDKTAYRAATTEYSKELRNSKRKSWRTFCQNIEDTPNAARLHKVLSKDHSNGLGQLRGMDGEMTGTDDETLSLMLETHFPGSRIFLGNKPNQDVSAPRRGARKIAAKLFTKERIRWAIESFKPYKSPGGDGIYPVLLQRGLQVILPDLVDLFRRSFTWGYIPDCWRDVRVSFIPKAGKRPGTDAKSFRPISLSSFLLKAMEKIIDQDIRAGLLSKFPLHKDQYAYQAGKSTISALHGLTRKLEKAIEYKEVALCAFIDIEGAFSNTPRQSIHRALVKRGVEPATVAWIMASLSSRIINMQLGAASVTATPGDGCPQGGCLSPLLWSLVVDDLLKTLTSAGFEICGYADDLVIMVRGKHDDTISDRMQTALTLTHEWCIREGLNINPKKTILLPFTRRKKLSLKKITMNGTTLIPTNHTKYLGVIFDQKLSWSLHLEAVISKGQRALFTCQRMVGSTWGLKPELTNWIYKSIVRPIVSYAALVWWPRAKLVSGQLALGKLQRTACLSITGASRSCPTAALQVILDLPPLEIFLESEAARWALRVARERELKTGDYTGHLRILNECKELQDVVTDNLPLRHEFRKNFTTTLPSRDQWANKELVFPRGSTVFYTDGSKTEDGRVGAGVYGPSTQLAIPMGLCPSVFQAETLAIRECVALCAERNYQRKEIYIASDSKAALLALDSPQVKSKLVWECKTSLNLLGEKNQVNLIWVPGHSGIHGNEAADQLAREGGTTPFTGPEPFCGFPASHQAMAIKDWEQKRKLMSWRTTNGQRQAKLLLSHSTSWTKKVLSLSKLELRKLTGALTGHCPVRYHLKNMGKAPDSTCRFCQEATETASHLLCECEAVHQKRLRHLGSWFLKPEQVMDVAPRKVVKFIETLLPDW